MKHNLTMKKVCISLLILALMFTVTLSMMSCSGLFQKVHAKDLTEGIKAQAVKGRSLNERFVNNTANFSIELFKQSIQENENSLISPVSVMLALAMTANGAANETLIQMENVLGGDIPQNELNEYLNYYVNSLPSEEKSKLNMANSIWFRDNNSYLTVEKDFLQVNADYYNAAIYKSPFDKRTINDINNWVKKHTDGMIDKIVDRIDEINIMYLINAVVFDAQWESVYKKNDLYNSEFSTSEGMKKTVEFMRSEESLYLDDGNATGFIKPYYNDNYSFVAMLPNEDVLIDDYINSLSGEGFINTLKKDEKTPVSAHIPKFSYEYSIEMNDSLKTLGMPDAFSADLADFTGLGQSPIGNIYIGEVLHKTFISVDELGTKAGAATKVAMLTKGALIESKVVKLDRPFVYAIVDNNTNLPIFIGTVLDPESEK